MSERRGFKQTKSLKAKSLKERLAAFTAALRQKTESTAPSLELGELEKKIRRAETAAEVDGWANSRGLQPPK
jgi:hypothetical protein